MSRIRQYFHNVTSGSVFLAVTAVYGLASLPLANYFLEKKEFGLWVTCSTIAGYLALLDLGISSSMARLLVDHKDKRASGDYGSMIKTGLLVCGFQAVIILATGLAGSLILPHLLHIEAHLQRQFTVLMIGVSITTTATFLTRIFNLILTAHQRIDIYNYGQILSLVASFAALWLGFRAQFGVFSLVLGSACGWLTSTAYAGIACGVLGFWPGSGEWGPASRARFKELYSYAMDLFFICLGSQVVNSSQSLVVTRALSLEASAIWGVMTKAFTLVSQLVWRPISMTTPAFAEMYVTGEQERMWERYLNLYGVLMGLASAAAVLFAACNRPFVLLLMHNKYQWPVLNDVLLGLWLILLTAQAYHGNMLMCLKRIGGLRFIYFFEGIAFVLSSLWLTPRGGVTALVGCSTVCTLVFSFSYTAWRMRELMQVSLSTVLIRWNRPVFLVLGLLGSVAVPLVYLTRNWPLVAQLGIRGGVLSALAVYIIMRECLTIELAGRLQGFLPKPLRGLIRV